MLIKQVLPLFSPKGIFVSAFLSDDIEKFISGEKIFLCQEKDNYNRVMDRIFEFRYSKREVKYIL
jgi:hypothetical protein